MHISLHQTWSERNEKPHRKNNSAGGTLSKAGFYLRLPALLLALVTLAVLAGCSDEGKSSPLAMTRSTPAPSSIPAAQNSATATNPTFVTPFPAITSTSPPSTSTSVSDTPNTSNSQEASERPPTTYVVQPGDTLSGVAAEFGISNQALAAANGIAPDDFLYIGQVLSIPAQTPAVRATVVASDRPLGSAQVSVVPTAPFTPVIPAAAQVTQPPSSEPAAPPDPVVINGRTYDAYIPAAIKKKQWYQYTCEFDAAWIVLETYGYASTLDDMIRAVGLDTSIEPNYIETADGVVVYGGDIFNTYSGDYKKNFLARSTGQAMRKVFEAYGLNVTAVQERVSLEAALLRGELVWIKTTVDFKPWVPVTWVMPDGRTTKGVLGNDHALVVMGFNKYGVVIRDPLGPTSTNRQRKYEYEVKWSTFMAAWGAQQFDGLAVAPPKR